MSEGSRNRPGSFTWTANLGSHDRLVPNLNRRLVDVSRFPYTSAERRLRIAPWSVVSTTAQSCFDIHFRASKSEECRNQERITERNADSSGASSRRRSDSDRPCVSMSRKLKTRATNGMVWKVTTFRLTLFASSAL